jgi:hypothetical protein
MAHGGMSSDPLVRRYFNVWELSQALHTYRALVVNALNKRGEPAADTTPAKRWGDLRWPPGLQEIMVRHCPLFKPLDTGAEADELEPALQLPQAQRRLEAAQPDVEPVVELAEDEFPEAKSRSRLPSLSSEAAAKALLAAGAAPREGASRRLLDRWRARGECLAQADFPFAGRPWASALRAWYDDWNQQVDLRDDLDLDLDRAAATVNKAYAAYAPFVEEMADEAKAAFGYAPWMEACIDRRERQAVATPRARLTRAYDPDSPLPEI